MNKIGIEIIKGLTNLLIELDKKEEARTEKEERRHKELLEVLKNMGDQGQPNIQRVDKEELEKVSKFIEEKKEKKTKKEDSKIEVQSLFEEKAEEKEEQLLMDQLHEKILEAGKNDNGGEIQELNFNSEEEDVVTENLGSDTNEAFALVPEEVLEENQKVLDEALESFDEGENEDNVEEEVKEENKESDVDDEDGMLSLLNNISNRIAIDEEKETEIKEETKEEVVPETKEDNFENEKEKMLEEIHSYPRMKNDYPIIDDEILEALVNPDKKLTLTKKATVRKIKERLDLEREGKKEVEEEPVEKEPTTSLESAEILANDVDTIDMSMQKEIIIEGENLTDEEREIIKGLVENKSTNPITQFGGAIKLLEDDSIEYAGEVLYRIEYMKDLNNKDKIIFKAGTKTGYASPEALIGNKVGIWPGVKIFSGAIVESNTALFPKEGELNIVKGMMVKAKTAIRTLEDINAKVLTGKEYKIVD